MASPFRRRVRRHATLRAPAAPTQRHARLHLELLEARLVLSGSPLDGYNLISASWFGSPASPPEAHESTATEWIVRLTPEATAAAANVSGARAVLGNLGFSYDVVRGLGLPGQLVLQTYAVDENLALSALDSHSAIAAAGRNAAIQGAITNANDAEYAQGRLFGLNLTTGAGVGNPAVVDADIDAPEAWDVTTGAASVVVAVLDSGLDYNHPDIANNVWTSGGVHGHDFFSQDADPMDVHGHGTHVAGIIGAEGNNNDGITGVNWDVTLLPVRVLGPANSGDLANAIAGINYVTGLASGFNVVTGQSVAPVNVRVINASWAVAGQFVDAGTKVQLLQSIQAAGAADILVVVAAGNGDLSNNAVDLNSASYLPATLERDQAVTLDNLIVVAASDPTDRLTYFSNYGAGIVDLAAPGDDILSTLPGGDYGFRDGTSMAAPFVSGVAALVLANPANPQLSASDVKEAILNSVDPLAIAEDRAKLAAGGRLNAFGAVSYSAFAPRVSVQMHDNIVTPGAATHPLTIRYSGKTAIDTGSLGLNDIIVRKGTNGSPLTVSGVSFALVGGDPKVVDATYVVAGPGDGVWNGPDNGAYQIEIVEGSVSDAGQGVRAQTFAGVAGFSVNITQGVFTVGRMFDAVDTNPGNGVPDIDGAGSGFTLRGAIQEANLIPGSVVVIPAGTYTLSLAGTNEDFALTGDLDILNHVTIANQSGGQVIINAAGLDRVFDVRQGAAMTINGVTITGGSVIDNGGGVLNRGTLTVVDSTIDHNTAANGGGVYNLGTLSAHGSAIELNNATYSAGGVFNALGATFDLKDSNVANNVGENSSVPSFDPTFDGDGKVTSDFGEHEGAYASAVQADGKVVVGGFIDLGPEGNQEGIVVRYNADGSLDGTFGVGGRVIVDFGPGPECNIRELLVQPDGKIVAVGDLRTGAFWDMAVARLNADGSLDTTFSSDGMLIETSVGASESCVGLQADGKILVAGTSFMTFGSGDFTVFRYNVDGTPDLSWDGDGKAVTQFGGSDETPQSIAIFGDKIYVGGTTDNDNAFIVRYNAANGSRDNSFDGGGIFSSNLGGDDAAVYSLAVQPDGKLLAAGWREVGANIDFAVVRLNVNGTFDSSFDGDGIATTEVAPQLGGVDVAYGISIQADGKIVAVGRSNDGTSDNLSVVRYNASGSLDSTFSGDGKFTTEFYGGTSDIAYDVTATAEGQIIAAGYTYHSTQQGDVALVRLNAFPSAGGGVYNAGELSIDRSTIAGNTASVGGGVFNADAAAVTMTNSTASDNSAVGGRPLELDPSFDGDGRKTTPIGTGNDAVRRVLVQLDGKYIVGGTSHNGSNNDFALVRYNQDGSLDPSFSGDGKATVDLGSSNDDLRAVALQADGKIVAAGTRISGSARDFAVVRFNADGSLDSSFDGDGVVLTDFASSLDEGRSVAIQVDGKIVVAGYSLDNNKYSFALTRYLANGALDATFSGDGKERTDVGASDAYADGVVIAPDGKIIAVGQSYNGSNTDVAVVRYLPNGTRDVSFSGDGRQISGFGSGDDETYSVVVDSAGGVIIGGHTNSGQAKFLLARYAADGTFDASWAVNGFAAVAISGTSQDFGRSLALQPDGRILIAGWSTDVGKQSFALMRFDSDGALDESFGVGGKVLTAIGAGDDEGQSVAVASDGKIIVAGSSHNGNNNDFAVVRYIADSDHESAGDGGGVFNAGTLTATNVTLSGNEANSQGGGIHNASTGTVTLSNATVMNNHVVGATSEELAPAVFTLTATLTTPAPSDLAAGDVTGDGIADLLVSNPALVNAISLFRGNGDGTFQSPTYIFETSSDYGLMVADLDDDGDNDVVAPTGYGGASGSVKVALNTGGGTFSSPVEYDTGEGDWTSTDVTVADFDGDGHNDLAVTNLGVTSPTEQNGSIKILWGLGGGAFEAGPRYPLQTGMFALVAGNIDADPEQELVAVSRDSFNLSVLEYVGNRQFEVGAPINVRSGTVNPAGDFIDLAIADLNGDSKLDLAVAAPSSAALYVLLGNGDGTFQAGTNYSPGEGPVNVVVGDVNGDDGPDLAFADFYSGVVKVLLNNGTGAFTPQADVTIGYGPWSTVLQDFDGNGTLDLAVMRQDGSTETQVFLNDLPPIASGAVTNAPGGTANLKNTIIAQNTSARRAPDVTGAFTSLGGNLVGDVGSIGDATGLVHGANGNKVGNSAAPIDPKLGPLADNGGPTKTHHPAADSPAIDAGIASGAPAVDQRGAARPADGDHNGSAIIDIGAVESFFASISGKKFHDRNGNGIQDDGEDNLPGWTIYLDLDQDGRLDPQEPFDVTDANGGYEFIGLTPGTYTVAEVLQAGWRRTHVGTSYFQEFRDDDVGGGVDGLNGARTIAATADDRFVYVAGAEEAKIARFERNATTGQLTYLGTTSSVLTVGGHNVLSSVEQLAVGTTVSGSHLYALTPLGAIVVFSVNTTTGELTFSEVLRDGETHGTPIQQMTGATGMTVSPDGTRVYVSNNGPSAPNGGAIFVFERSGAALLLRRRLTNSASVQGAGGRGMAISPDGSHIYVAGATSDASDTLALFERQPGATWIRQLNNTPAWVLKNNQNDSAGNFVHGLDGANAITMSPDGKFLYVTAATDGAVTVFARNAANGSLTFVQTLSDGDADSLGGAVSGLEQASAVAISSDGERVYVAGKVIDKTDPENPISTGAIVTFRRDAVTGRLSILEKLIDGVADGYGAPIESIDVTAALLAPDGQFLYAAAADYEDALTAFRRDAVGRDSYTLAAGEVLTDVDFANRALPGAIYGLVYDNRNSDADQDLDERALAGWEVFLDVNGNGVWDASLPILDGAPEPLTESDPSGVYAFENLAADAAYAVRMRPRSGWAVTAPVSQAYQVTISPGEIELNKNFGVTLQSILGAGFGSLSGLVFRDANEDGVQAPVGEPGLGNLKVFLDLDDDNVLDVGEPIVTTVASGIDVGKYTFGNVPDTAFTIRIDPASVPASQRIVAPLGNALTEQSYDLNPHSNPTQLASADVDVDGDLDIVVLTLDGVASIFRNNGNGQFADRLSLPNSFGANSLAVGDFNADGRPDIALASSTLGKVAVAMNQPVPTGQLAFGAYDNNLTTSLANWDVVAADFNGDGKADLALAQRAAVLTNLSNVLVLHSTTTGLTPSFALSQTIQVGRQPRALEVAQVDGVGGLDLLLVNQHDRTLQVVLKSGATFGAAETAIPLSSLMGSAVDTPFTLTTGHFNGDSKLDILVGNSHTSAVSLLISAPNPLYGPGGWDLLDNQSLDARGLPRDLAVVDIDGDGDRDVLAGTVGPSGITLFRNIGTATAPKFAQGEVKGVGNLQTADLPGVKSLVVGDFGHNGGLPDVAAVSGKIDAGALLVFANSTINGAHRVATAGNLTGLNFALAPTQAGDYDGDADVDGFDFLKWQRSFGGGSATGADGDGNGVVNGADLSIWKMHFGTPASVAAASAALTVDPSGTSDDAAAATTSTSTREPAILLAGWRPTDRAVADLTKSVVGRPRRNLPGIPRIAAPAARRTLSEAFLDTTEAPFDASHRRVADDDGDSTDQAEDSLETDFDAAFAEWGETTHIESRAAVAGLANGRDRGRSKILGIRP